MYEPNCGLENFLLSWGHDKYLYGVLINKSNVDQFSTTLIDFASDYDFNFMILAPNMACMSPIVD